MVRNGLVVIFIVNFVAAWANISLRDPVDDEAKRTMPVVLAAAQAGRDNGRGRILPRFT